jgi:tRNA G18 (ribose-2'-O)-methylase SpoU
VEILRVSKRDSAFQIILALKTNRSKRNELKEVFVEGTACIKNAVRAGKKFKSIIFRDYDGLSDWGKGLIADQPGARLLSFDEALYGEICDKSEPSEIVATVEKEDMELRDARLSAAPFIIVVDRPSSHGNLGSMIRSANAFGADLLVTGGFIRSRGDTGLDRRRVLRGGLPRAFHEGPFRLDRGIEGSVSEDRGDRN